MAFKLFDCEEFHSEFQALEVARHTPLTDKMSLHYFELPKLPEGIDAKDEVKLWLALFKAETEEDLAKIEAMEVTVMNETIEAYWQGTATDEFREIERQRSRARHNEASALGHARREGLREGRYEGIREGEQKQSQEITKRALKEGMPIEIISKITGLTASEIQKL